MSGNNKENPNSEGAFLSVGGFNYVEQEKPTNIEEEIISTIGLKNLAHSLDDFSKSLPHRRKRKYSSQYVCFYNLLRSQTIDHPEKYLVMLCWGTPELRRLGDKISTGIRKLKDNKDIFSSINDVKFEVIKICMVSIYELQMELLKEANESQKLEEEEEGKEHGPQRKRMRQCSN